MNRPSPRRATSSRKTRSTGARPQKSRTPSSDGSVSSAGMSGRNASGRRKRPYRAAAAPRTFGSHTRYVPICSSCGQENPEGFRFCGRRGGSPRGAAARWRGALAKVLAVRGQEDGAEALAQEAATLVEPTPFMALQGDVLADGGVVASSRRSSARGRSWRPSRHRPRLDRLESRPMPIHVRAEPGDYAEAVLLPGDPLRAKYIAETYLEAVEQRNAERGLLGYTGTWNGKSVSVQGTGMGCPGATIVFEELVQLGCKKLIRVGTCGGLQPSHALGDLIVALTAVPADSTAMHLVANEPHCPTASWDVVH